jgi:hypothetical protein
MLLFITVHYIREEHRLTVFENRVLRRIFGPKRDDVTCDWRTLHSEELLNCTHPLISLGRLSQGKCVGWDMWHTWERRGKCTRFWWKSQKERDHLEDQDADWRMGSEWIIGRLAGGV